ncbi:hypothetical protein D3C81_1675320 [compost metagenome]
MVPPVHIRVIDGYPRSQLQTVLQGIRCLPVPPGGFPHTSEGQTDSHTDGKLQILPDVAPHGFRQPVDMPAESLIRHPGCAD